MTHFSCWVIGGHDKFLFYFTKMFDREGLRYYVTTSNKNKNLIAFSMKQGVNGNWKILNEPLLPFWISVLEEELSKCIIEHESL